jgi:ABC-2 type transport system permease protein/sodium transport system permease protein
VFGGGLTAAALVQVLLLLVLFAAFFSAVVLALTSFARSFKEAQAYLIPLMLLCLVPGMLALLPGLHLQGPLAVVPLINIVLLARDVFAGTASLPIAGLVVITTLLYALASVALAARVFGAETVLSSEPGGWVELFRRSNRPRPHAEPASALLCLALMFPVYFLLNNTLARIGDLDLPARLGLAAVAQVVLFAGFPLLSAWLGRIELVRGFRLHWPGWQPCTAAVLLGAGLWPFVHELVALENAVGLHSLRAEYLDRMREALTAWRTYSPWLMVAILALAPAVLEELFFRGYLLAALAGEGGKDGRAVFASAALFALFHLLVLGSLAVERLLPSFLLGLVLGWLAVASGSVLPGMLLHVIHNAVIVLMGYYQPELTARGWLTEGQEHLPGQLFAVAAPLAVLGLVWLGRLARRMPQNRGENDHSSDSTG